MKATAAVDDDSSKVADLKRTCHAGHSPDYSIGLRSIAEVKARGYVVRAVVEQEGIVVMVEMVQRFDNIQLLVMMDPPSEIQEMVEEEQRSLSVFLYLIGQGQTVIVSRTLAGLWWVQDNRYCECSVYLAQQRMYLGRD